MKLKIQPIGHLILFCIISFIVLFYTQKYFTNQNMKDVVVALVFIIGGIWGNCAKMIFLQVPTGPKSYKYVNYILIIIGVSLLILSSYRYFTESI